MSNEDKYFLSENYLVPGSQPIAVDYRKFLEDIKLHGSAPSKTLAGLTKEQYDMYNKFSTFLKQKNQVQFFVRAVLEKDTSKKMFLP